MRDSNGMHREPFTFTRTVLNGIEMVRGLYLREALRKTPMARITPIDVNLAQPSSNAVER